MMRLALFLCRKDCRTYLCLAEMTDFLAALRFLAEVLVCRQIPAEEKNHHRKEDLLFFHLQNLEVKILCH